jgi:hypothetical protein
MLTNIEPSKLFMYHKEMLIAGYSRALIDEKLKNARDKGEYLPIAQNEPCFIKVCYKDDA